MACFAYLRTLCMLVLIAGCTQTGLADDFTLVFKKKVGNPDFRPAGIALTEPVALPTFESFISFFASVFPQPNHVLYPDAGFLGPGEPHPGPYGLEPIIGLKNLGVKQQQVFFDTDFANPDNFLVLFYNLVPTRSADLGVALDAVESPVRVMQRDWPVTISAQIFKNGQLDVDFGSFEVPPADVYGEQTDENGVTRDFTGTAWGHLPLIFSFGPNPEEPVGFYRLRTSLRDTAGNGWDFDVPLLVLPDYQP